MSRIRPSTDVRPVTEFRANASAFLDQVQSTKRPVVLTQHGRSAAVLLDVGVYEDLLDEVALLRDVRTAEGQIEAGKVAPHSVVARRLKARLLKCRSRGPPWPSNRLPRPLRTSKPTDPQRRCAGSTSCSRQSQRSPSFPMAAERFLK